jgi:hypothetical protein
VLTSARFAERDSVVSKQTKTMVTERALLQRVNRKLAPKEQKVRRNRPFYDGPRELGRAHYTELGRFYVVDTARNTIDEMDINLEEIGRELGAMGACEALQEDGRR